jgi:hypothetical protein
MKKELSKAFIPFFILIAFIFISCKPNSIDIKTKPAAVDSLKTVTQKIVFYNNGVEMKDTITSEITKNNSDGLPSEVTTYNFSDKGISSVKEYKYNNKQKTIFEKLTSFSTSLKGYAIAYEYDSLNRMIKRTTFDETGNILNEYKNEFKDTLRMKELQYSPNKTLVRETNLFYDADNNNIKTEGKYLDKPLTFKMIYEYDKNNHKIKDEVYRADDGIKMYLVTRVQLFYDGKGRVIKQLGFDGKGNNTVTSTCSFNSADQLAETEMTNTLTKEYKKSLFKYNSSGKTEEELVYYKKDRPDHKIIYFY